MQLALALPWPQLEVLSASVLGELLFLTHGLILNPGSFLYLFLFSFLCGKKNALLLSYLKINAS